MSVNYKIMTPGPTQVAEHVRMARSLPTTNPDIDESFVEFYKETCDKLAKAMHTKEAVYILGGEGILGLEAACATLTEKGDRVLVIDNGIFGKGFADFVTMYGGEAVLYSTDYTRSIDCKKLKDYLECDHDFKYATVVHCDTPSGVLNPVDSICPLLKSYGILTVVDSVAAMFGDELQVDNWQIDIACGGSQKALSAPPGLTFVSFSKEARKAAKARKTPVASFYANLLAFETYYEDKWFPYTMPISDIYGLAAAVDDVLKDKDRISRHVAIAKAVRDTLEKAGLSLYVKEGWASTVTAVEVPEGMTDKEILNYIREEYQIMLAGCFDVLAGKVIRIGHMGNNANIPDVADTLKALQGAFEFFGRKLSCDMKEEFLKRV